MEGTDVDGLDLWDHHVTFKFFSVFVVLFKVHENWYSWGGKSKFHTSEESEMDSDEMSEVDVVDMWLSKGEDSVDSAEGGGDIKSPGGEFNLVLWVVELDSVFIDELAEEVTSDLEVLGETLWSDLLWPKLSTDLLELLGEEVEDLFPSDLVGCVLHNTGNKSIFASKIGSEVANDVVDGSMLVMLLEKSLKSETELEEVGSEDTSLVRHWLASIWVGASFFWLSAKGVESGDLDGKVLAFELLIEVGQHFFLKIYKYL